jgi:hypothetical protein
VIRNARRVAGHETTKRSSAVRSRAGLGRKYPTGALGTRKFSCRWGDVPPGRAELTDFVTPKELAKRCADHELSVAVCKLYGIHEGVLRRHSLLGPFS